MSITRATSSVTSEYQLPNPSNRGSFTFQKALSRPTISDTSVFQSFTSTPLTVARMPVRRTSRIDVVVLAGCRKMGRESGGVALIFVALTSKKQLDLFITQGRAESLTGMNWAAELTVLRAVN